MALAEAISKEAHSDEERAFLMAELVMELARVTQRPTPGYVTPEGFWEASKPPSGSSAG